MKELSIKEKAKAYDKAIELIKKCATDKYGCVIGIKPSDIFSELKESEDERIRKAIIALIEWSKSYSSSGITNDDAKKMIAWLENKDNKLVPKFSIGQRIRNRKGEMPAFVIDRIENDLYKGENGESISVVFQDDWELVEQKPIRWSEEDERILAKIIEKLDISKNINHYEYSNFEIWLTELKEKLTK